MIQIDISEIQFDGALRLREGGDKEIGSERDGRSNGWLAIHWQSACSPKTMTFPGADTMNVGAIGNETFLSIAPKCRNRR